MEQRKNTEEKSPPQPTPGAPGPYPYPYPYPYDHMEEDEIDLFEYWDVIWQRKKMISAMIFIVVAVTIIYSIMLPNIYMAKAVIIPSEKQKAIPSGLAGMAAQFTGISLPGSPALDEIKGLLGSNILKKNIIEKYDLIPLLFPDRWDKEKGRWKGPGKLAGIIQWLNPRFLLSQVVKKVHPPPESIKKQGDNEDPAPDIYDAIRALEDMIKVNESRKSADITISVESKDPRFAARLVGYILLGLKEHMSIEAIRTAKANKEYLINQLDTTTDPIIRNKIYELIANQVEIETMAGNPEGYAFKVLDPPMVPDQKVRPKRSMMVVLSVVVSAFSGIFLAFFIEYVKKAREKSENKDAGDKE